LYPKQGGVELYREEEEEKRAMIAVTDRLMGYDSSTGRWEFTRACVFNLAVSGFCWVVLWAGFAQLVL
jgi:hypothetical protein